MVIRLLKIHQKLSEIKAALFASETNLFLNTSCNFFNFQANWHMNHQYFHILQLEKVYG